MADGIVSRELDLTLSLTSLLDSQSRQKANVKLVGILTCNSNALSFAGFKALSMLAECCRLLSLPRKPSHLNFSGRRLPSAMMRRVENLLAEVDSCVTIFEESLLANLVDAGLYLPLFIIHIIFMRHKCNQVIL